MLDIQKLPQYPAGNYEPGMFASPAQSLSSAIFFLRRRYRAIGIATAACLVLGTIYLISAPSRYTAEASLLIDTRKVHLFQQPMLGDTGIDAATVESQAEILKSESIAQSVIEKLDLADDPEFVGAKDGLFAQLKVLLRFLEFDRGDEAYERARKAIKHFKDNLSVKRVGLTYIINVTFTSKSSEKSARIANAIVDAYLVDTLEAKYQSTKRASSWLEDRLRELRQQAAAAATAVVEYKTKNNIVESNGRLMDDQQLAEINTQLVLARSQEAEANARYERIGAVLKNGNTDGAVTDALKNDVIVRLRGQLSDLSKREADWSQKYGPNHQAVVNLQNEMTEVRKSILSEVRRIAETYKSDYEIAKARREAIQKSMKEVVAQTQETNQAQVALKDLESTAESYRSLYDNFLQRYMESVQQQTFPITEARSITRATPPLNRSSPKTLLTLALALIGGVVAGLSVGLVQELLERVVRTGEDLENLTGVECLATLPLLGESVAGQDGVANLSAGDAFGRAINQRARHTHEIIASPFSQFAEGMRSIKVALDLVNVRNRNNKVIGITSSLPDEGKSTISINLALLLAQSGKRVVLLDGDLRNPSLTRSLAPDAGAGLIEVLTGKASLADSLWTDPSTGLGFLPMVLKTRLSDTSNILSSPRMGKFFQDLRERFDYIVVDFSPLAPVVDVRSSIHLVDSFLYVVEWGETKLDVVKYALKHAHFGSDKLLGTILNKVDMRTIGRYESYKDGYFRNESYARYGYVD